MTVLLLLMQVAIRYDFLSSLLWLSKLNSG